MKNKQLGIALLAIGGGAIYYLYKRSQNVDLGKAPKLEYKEIEKEPLTVVNGNPVYMDKDVSQKIMYDMKSLEDNRFYLDPTEFKKSDTFKELEKKFDYNIGNQIMENISNNKAFLSLKDVDLSDIPITPISEWSPEARAELERIKSTIK